MTEDIRTALSPLLTVSFILGTRIVEFPVGQPKLWYSFLYILILWSLYFTLLIYTLIRYIQTNSLVYQTYFWMNISTALLSVLLGIYHDKKFRSCLRKLTIVDDTLKKLGIITDYHKLYTRILWIILGWFLYCLWSTLHTILWHGSHNNIIKDFNVGFMIEYASYVNILNDLIIVITLGYIELKFGQINKHLQLDSDKMPTIKKAWENSRLQRRPITRLKSMSNENIIWVVMHLHLELCKISRDLNSIFGLQMTVKIGTYFVHITLLFRELFNITMLKNYEFKGTSYFLLVTIALTVIIFRLFIINYMCERISVKANTTGDVISSIPYSTYDVVVRENISQFLLQLSLAPLKFYGLGLFQFGFKLLQKFCTSVTTVSIVILVQSHINK